MPNGRGRFDMTTTQSDPPAKSIPASLKSLHIALIGNPNTGKSTLFNALAGMNARTGNYPGVTVERKTGRTSWNGRALEFVDLPGTYSLSPRSLDEMVTVDVLLGRQATESPVDVIICVADASNLERNLYLLGQLLELGLPTVLALNMWDSAQRSGLEIDVEKLSTTLGVPVVRCEANNRVGISELKNAILSAVGKPPSIKHQPLTPGFYQTLNSFHADVEKATSTQYPLYMAERMLLDQGGVIEQRVSKDHGQTATDIITNTRAKLKASGFTIPGTEASQRYQWSSDIVRQTISQKPVTRKSWTERLDACALHPFLGPVIFTVIMLLVFQAITSWASPLADGLESVQGQINGFVEAGLEPGPLRSLLVDGVVAGVGGVLVFLPQIALLFLFIAILEDSGYMARAAFMMDRLMMGLGLNGKSFLPLMSSFACAVPGIMATRTIDNNRDRLITILIAPLMSCSARLPVYLLIVGTLIPNITYLGGWVTLPGLMLLLMNSIGLILAIPIAMLLKNFMVSEDPSPFLLELPRYQRPSIRVVLSRVYERSMSFITTAGTFIFATTIVIWALATYPGDHTPRYAVQKYLESQQAILDDMEKPEDPQTPVSPEVAALTKTIDSLQHEHDTMAASLIEKSYMGQMGHAIEPLVRPLGWDWKIGVGVIASFPAREVIVATLGIIYSLGGEVDEESEGLVSAIQNSQWPDGSPVYTIPVGLSIMVFFALCAQCVSTLVVIGKETNSWWWPTFSFVYMTVLAYVVALIVYQVGTAMMG